jgi:hypothetical protein
MFIRQFLKDCSKYTNKGYNAFISSTNTIMGITKEVIRQGNGQTPVKGQKVTVNCTGYGKDRDLSQKFWSTKDPGQEVRTYLVACALRFLDSFLWILCLSLLSLLYGMFCT